MSPTPLLRTILAYVAGVVAWFVFPLILGMLYTTLLPGEHSVNSVQACMFGVVVFSFQPIMAIAIFSLLLPRLDKAAILYNIIPLALLCCIGGGIFCVIFPLYGADVTASNFPISLAVMFCGCFLGSFFGYYLASKTNHPVRDLIGRGFSSTIGRPLVIPSSISAIIFFSSILMFNHQPTQGGGVSLADLIAFITLWPLLIVAAVLSIYALIRLFTAGHPLAYLLILLFSATPFWYIAAQMIKQNQALAEENKIQSWVQYGDKLNPLIIDYIMKNPNQVTFPGKYDVARITGLGDYLRSRETDIPVRGDDIIDPWGDPLEIVIEHTQPMMLIEGSRTEYGVWSQNGNKITVGLYEPTPTSRS